MTKYEAAAEYPTIQPKDRVTVDGCATEYTVLAVSRAGQDVYVREADSKMTGGTWVGITSVTLLAEESGQ